MPMKKKIFVVDDEKDIQDILRVNLSLQNLDVRTFSSGEEALAELKNGQPDLILLDVMMDGMDGFEFCKTLRSSTEYRDVPVIFLSAKTEEFDRVLGLELGGDDYIAKPFSMKEVSARVKAVLRRTDTKTRQILNEKKIAYKGVELFPEKYALKIDGRSVKLTKTEFEILFLFLKHPEKIFTRDNIIDSIRGDDVYVIDRTIDVHIMNLRKKLGKYKNIITTFSGVGYGFKE
jgi:two-component system phosphate regulon response regulator PhoB/two-component system alkaline phosphatase synthesis response regulator PhoP